MKISIRSALVLSTCLLLGWSASAFGAAGRDDAVVSKTVKFKDLDIAKAAGAQALYGRISAAAREVCRAQAYNTVRSCRARAVDDAVVGVASPLLTSIHRSAVERVEEVVLR
ncbi:MAG TPA: UrcA family protein [Gammaproteobacteria bacterium]|nr:UrcA family protein [Gammaproteobacteria bacterium]